MYASTVEQSCKYSGHVDSACSTRVSRVVTIAEFRSVMPIIGTRPHSMAVAITTAAVLFFVCIPRMVTAYLPSVYLGWQIPPILPRQCSRGACWWWIRKIPGRAKARRGSNKNVCGGVLLSHTLPGAVPSPCQALASGFGKGPGVTPGPWPPQKPPSTARTPKRGPRPAKRKTTHAPPPARAVTVREPDSGREHRFVTTGTTLLVANNPAAAKTRTHPHTRGEWAAMSPSPVSTGRLHPSRGFHLRPIKHVFHMRASGPRRAQGILISEQASRLDAFSGYPSRT